MSNDGWISVYRKLTHSDLWLCEKFTKGQAWVDLLALANHKTGTITAKNGLLIPIARSECGYSELSLGKRWKWSRGKVKRFIVHLTVQQMVQQKIVSNQSIITVLNYEKYQMNIKQDTEQDSPRYTNNKINKLNKDNNKNKKESKPKKTDSEESLPVVPKLKRIKLETLEKIKTIWDCAGRKWGFSHATGSKAVENGFNSYVKTQDDCLRVLDAFRLLINISPSDDWKSQKWFNLAWMFRKRLSNGNSCDHIQELIDGRLWDQWKGGNSQNQNVSTMDIFEEMRSEGMFDE